MLLCVGAANALTSITDCTGLQNMKNDLTEDYVLTTDLDCGSAPTFNPVGAPGGSGMAAPLHGRWPPGT